MKLPQSFEASISRAELLRLLPAAVGGLTFIDSGESFTHRADGRSWRIRMTPLPERVLGLLRWRPLRLDFSFEGYDPAEIESFMARFELHFWRGGG